MGRKEEIIRDLFVPHDSEVILAIPLSLNLLEDTRVWHFTRSIEFTVHSAYLLYQERTVRLMYQKGSSAPVWNKGRGRFEA